MCEGPNDWTVQSTKHDVTLDTQTVPEVSAQILALECLTQKMNTRHLPTMLDAASFKIVKLMPQSRHPQTHE